ncbi:MAG: YgjV family protein [Clostridia bacterium]|nr:YgjV family protein [Clostridia bacterium]
MNTNIWANVFGVMGIVTSVIIYQQKENRNMLIWKLITDTVWVIHYLMLQANSVAVVTMVAMARSVILLCQNHAWARHKAWLWVFLGSSFLLSLLAWKDWTSGLVMVASLACILAFWIGKPKITRMVSIPAAAMFLINVALNGSLWGTLNESFLLISAIVGVVRLDLKLSKASKPNQKEKRSEPR